MSHLHPTPPKYCLSAYPIINPLAHIYTYTVFCPLEVSYFSTASLASFGSPPALSLSGFMTQRHGRALLVMFCPIFLSPFRGKCCGRGLDGSVLTRLPWKEEKSEWETEERTDRVYMYIVIIQEMACLLMQQQQIYSLASSCRLSGWGEEWWTRRSQADKQMDRQTIREEWWPDDAEGDCEGMDGHGGESSVPQTNNQTSS